ncbi:hypothetical protein ACWPKO_22585 (plasmid) [Coraliomargarita sp. W4R53]
MSTASLLRRIRAILAVPDRDSLRDAKRRQRWSVDEYKRALDSMSPRNSVAVHKYHAALSAEAAANRAEARELRELLTNLTSRIEARHE